MHKFGSCGWALCTIYIYRQTRYNNRKGGIICLMNVFSNVAKIARVARSGVIRDALITRQRSASATNTKKRVRVTNKS